LWEASALLLSWTPILGLTQVCLANFPELWFPYETNYLIVLPILKFYDSIFSTQDFVFARQALFHLSHSACPDSIFSVSTYSCLLREERIG
jgi:hypothetical protein